MTNTLLPCPSCARHVRASTTTCPFCAESITLVAPTPRAITQRLGRAALFGIGAAAIVTAPGCIMATPVYGAPSDSGPSVQDTGAQPDSGSAPDAAAAPDTGTDGGLAGAYGAPPPNDGG